MVEPVRLPREHLYKEMARPVVVQLTVESSLLVRPVECSLRSLISVLVLCIYLLRSFLL